jgi:hypothetical protein
MASTTEKINPLEPTISHASTHKLEKVDTVHNDQAVQILRQYNGEQNWTDEEEKRLVRKIDLRLMTVLVISFCLQYYDKAMLSQAVCFHGRFPFSRTDKARYRQSLSSFPT